MSNMKDLVETEADRPDPKGSVISPGTEKPKSFSAAAKSSMDKRMSDEEARRIEAATEPSETYEVPPPQKKPERIPVPNEFDVEEEEDGSVAPVAELDSEIMECLDPKGDGGVPSWAAVPPNLKIPLGARVVFVRLRAAITRTPQKGDRTMVLWDLTPIDEDFAHDRTDGKSHRAQRELAKQMIRAFDGVKTEWALGKMSPVNKFWTEIGAKGRLFVMTIFDRLHNPTTTEVSDFFLKCAAFRSAAPAR